MFSLRRKIGMGATSRRRSARECKVGIECLDTRAVPAIIVPTPGSPLLESGTGTLGVNVSHVAFDEFGHGNATTTTLNPFTGATTEISKVLATNLDPSTGKATDVAGVVGTGTANPLTLAYKLPTPVQDGDVAFYNFQTGQLSDLIRFQTVSDPVAGTQGWMLVYSDPGGPGAADVGIPAPTHSVLTQSAIEFGVEGFNTLEYAAEQADYSGLSDFNPLPFGSA